MSRKKESLGSRLGRERREQLERERRLNSNRFTNREIFALVLCAVCVIVVSIWAFTHEPAKITKSQSANLRTENQNPPTTPERFKEEISRHVLDECDLYLKYGKNRIDVDPLQVALIIPGFEKEKWKERRILTREIYDVVKHEPSFYKRALTYNIYYQTCLNLIPLQEAERAILDIKVSRIKSEDIRHADETVAVLINARSDRDRVRRDHAKIALLTKIAENEPKPNVRHKVNSVIKELEHDIELWAF